MHWIAIVAAIIVGTVLVVGGVIVRRRADPNTLGTVSTRWIGEPQAEQPR